MQLKLAIDDGSGEQMAVVVECRPDTPSLEVLAALARHMGLELSQVGSARCARSGVTLAGSAPVAALDLRDGDLLVLGAHTSTVAADHPAAPPVVDLVVVAGPDSGRRVPLAEGTHVIGRGPGADVLLEDRSMSRRHLTITVCNGSATLADAGSSNGTFVGGQPVTATRRIEADDLFEAGRTMLRVEPHVVSADVRPQGDGVLFNRPPRVVRPASVPSWELRVPSEAGEKPQLSPVLLVPVAAGVVLFLITNSPFMLLFAGLAPLTALYTVIEGRRKGSRQRQRELEKFHAELDEIAAAYAEAREDELQRRHADAPDAARLYARVAGPEATLWERRPTDEDFLRLRVGTADLPPRATVKIAPGGDPALARDVTSRIQHDRPLPSVPVSVPLAGGALGVVGGARQSAALARWLIIQAAILHSPRDVTIAAAVTPERRSDWAWLHWLPHLAAAGVASDREAAVGLFEPSPLPLTRLLIVDGALRLPPALLDTLDERVCVIWLAPRVTELPAGCTAIVELDNGVDQLALTEVREGRVTEAVVPDGVAPEWAADVARLLAPFQDAAARDQSGVIPARVSLLELLDMTDPTPTALAERWTAADGLAVAPVGLAADGPFGIDIGQTDGLRMVLGGMPGTGKSELLQALIASLAVTHAPSRLGLLLVDYKGGAAFRDCAELPHTAGIVTDLDTALAERARVSLLAELRRREALLAEAGVRNLRELLARHPDDAPPTLVIVIDEFATLARELPAFVDTVVDVAQRGRSLGLHLVLATQRPRGAVSDAIRANTNLRIAMRVADAGESQDVIDAPNAASIPASLPGRAIALTGRGSDGRAELTEFQAGYAGGHTSGNTMAAVSVRELGGGTDPHGGARVLSTVGGHSPTDLQTIVMAAAEAAARLQLARPRAPWLEPLPDVLELDDLPATGPAVATLGLIDDPARQAQMPLRFDLEQDGSLVVYGASGSGKTALLRTLAFSLAAGTSPDEVQVYVLDFATRGLSSLEELPHCGSVIGADDAERVLRLLAHLRRELESRRQLLADGTSRPGEPGLPRIVLLLDGYANFASSFERVDFGAPLQAIARIAADGRALGLHVVLTADRRADVPGSLAGVIPARIVLRMASDDEYTALGLPRAGKRDRIPPGFGYIADGREFQTAWISPETSSARAEQLQSEHAGVAAPPIRRLPTRLGRERLPAPLAPLEAIVGVEDQLLAPVALDLAHGHALIAGPHRSGLSTALATIALSLQRGDPNLAMHLLAPRRSPLRDLEVWASMATDVDTCTDLATRLAASRQTPLVVVIDDGMELAEGAAASAMDALLRAGRDAEVRVVAAVDLLTAQRTFGGWVRELRNERSGLLLQVTSDAEAELLGARLPAQRGGPPPPGRGFLVERGVARLVQVAGA